MIISVFFLKVLLSDIFKGGMRLCCRASVWHSGKGTLDVESRGAPRDEGSSCQS